MCILTMRYYCSYTFLVKTAISLPDTLFSRAEETAKTMGIPRSQLYTKALEEYLERYQEEKITEKYDKVYSKLHENDLEENSSAIQSIWELTKNDSW